MNCTQTSECISALFDSQSISREVAAHLADCPECRAQLNEYAEMSAELRDMASAAAPQAIPEGRWRLAEPAAANNWLRKWRGTMRIPRLAFALMLIAIFALSGGLALVKARPGASGATFLLTTKYPLKGGVFHCSYKDYSGGLGPSCRGVEELGPVGQLLVSVRPVRREEDRVQLAVKVRYDPSPSLAAARSSSDALSRALENVSEVEYWLKPDKPLSIPVAGLGTIEISGEFLDHMTAETYGWFQYELRGRDGRRIMSGTAPTNPGGNPYYDVEAGMTYPEGMVWFHLRVVEQMGETEKIAAKVLWVPKGQYAGDFMERLRNMAEHEFLYTPGQDLKIPVEDYGNLEIRGHFEAKLPENVRMGLYPEDGMFRISPPVVLVREKEMLGKFDGGGGELSLGGSYFAYGEQDQGWFVFSSEPFAGAVEGTLKMNQIEFRLDGKQYFLFTGDPILFGSIKIWVKHYSSIRDADPTSPGDGWQGNVPRLAFGELENLAVEK